MKRLIALFLILAVFGLGSVAFARNCFKCPFCGMIGWPSGLYDGHQIYEDARGHMWICEW